MLKSWFPLLYSWYPNGKGSGQSSGQIFMYSIVFQSVFSIKNQYQFGAGPIGLRPFSFLPIAPQSLDHLGFIACSVVFHIVFYTVRKNTG
ncbi:hypothetical protein DZB84_23745 [Bacillus sp. HNG]|nr:hypothetical protein DZB84_23745 [Bacillus sp. HNG]